MIKILGKGPEIRGGLGLLGGWLSQQIEGAGGIHIPDGKSLDVRGKLPGDTQIAFRQNADGLSGVHKAHFGQKIFRAAEDTGENPAAWQSWWVISL